MAQSWKKVGKKLEKSWKKVGKKLEKHWQRLFESFKNCAKNHQTENFLKIFCKKC